MDLNVKIKNLGKVAHAKVSIRPLTLITGCNSSGKSFITRGLYSILHTLNQDVVSAYILNVLSLTNSALLRLSDGIPRRSADDDALLSDIGLLLEGVRQSVARQAVSQPVVPTPCLAACFKRLENRCCRACTPSEGRQGDEDAGGQTTLHRY
nr:hypothetical protein [Neisseria meningitidis]